MRARGGPFHGSLNVPPSPYTARLTFPAVRGFRMVSVNVDDQIWDGAGQVAFETALGTCGVRWNEFGITRCCCLRRGGWRQAGVREMCQSRSAGQFSASPRCSTASGATCARSRSTNARSTSSSGASMPRRARSARGRRPATARSPARSGRRRGARRRRRARAQPVPGRRAVPPRARGRRRAARLLGAGRSAHQAAHARDRGRSGLHAAGAVRVSRA